jgi:hypothetical protein
MISSQPRPRRGGCGDPSAGASGCGLVALGGLFSVRRGGSSACSTGVSTGEVCRLRGPRLGIAAAGGPLGRLGGHPVGVAGRGGGLADLGHRAAPYLLGGLAEVDGDLVGGHRAVLLGGDHADDVLAQGQLVLAADRREPARGGPGGRRGGLGRAVEEQRARPGDDVASLAEEHGVLGLLADAVVGDEGPAAVLAAPGVPLHGVGVDVLGAQPLGHRVSEGLRGSLAGLPAYRRGLGAVGDVGPLGEDGRGVRHDPVDSGLGGLGDGVRALAGTDPGLDVSGPQCAVHLNLQLAESCMVAAEGGPELGVRCQGVLLTRVTDEDELLLVLRQPHECEACIGPLLSVAVQVSLLRGGAVGCRRAGR